MKKDMNGVSTNTINTKSTNDKKQMPSMSNHYDTCIKINTIMEKNRQLRINAYK